MEHLRFYIHDHSRWFRLELLGSLNASTLAELDGCWQTAMGCIAGRRIRVDLTRLEKIDDAGLTWLRTVAEQANVHLAVPPVFRHEFQPGPRCEVVTSQMHAQNHCSERLEWLLALFRNRTQKPKQNKPERGSESIALRRPETEVSAS